MLARTPFLRERRLLPNDCGAAYDPFAVEREGAINKKPPRKAGALERIRSAYCCGVSVASVGLAFLPVAPLSSLGLGCVVD